MARPIPCDGECGQVAALIVTNPENGEVNGFCADDFVVFAVAFLQQFAPEQLAPQKAAGRGKSRQAPAAPVADDSQGGESTEPAAPAESRPA